MYKFFLNSYHITTQTKISISLRNTYLEWVWRVKRVWCALDVWVVVSGCCVGGVCGWVCGCGWKWNEHTRSSGSTSSGTRSLATLSSDWGTSFILWVGRWPDESKAPAPYIDAEFSWHYNRAQYLFRKKILQELSFLFFFQKKEANGLYQTRKLAFGIFHNGLFVNQHLTANIVRARIEFIPIKADKKRLSSVFVYWLSFLHVYFVVNLEHTGHYQINVVFQNIVRQCGTFAPNTHTMQNFHNRKLKNESKIIAKYDNISQRFAFLKISKFSFVEAGLLEYDFGKIAIHSKKVSFVRLEVQQFW